jgi:hypothetical protein
MRGLFRRQRCLRLVQRGLLFLLIAARAFSAACALVSASSVS